MNEERIKGIFADEEFVKELFSKETPEEAKALLEEKDVEFTVEEVIKLKEIIVAKMESAENGEEAELGDEDLEEVSGGVLPLFAVAAAIAPLVILGVVAAVCITGERNRW